MTPEDIEVYMGEDKFENEKLIAYGWPVDVWFHVDKLSSAHVYLRLPEGLGMENIPEDTLEDMCQLVKNNSISGCKLAQTMVVFTPWSNLHKDEGSMDTGTIGFHDSKKRCLRRAVRDKDAVKRLEKSKREVVKPDFQGQKLAYERGLVAARKTKERASRESDLEAKNDEAEKRFQANEQARKFAEQMFANELGGGGGGAAPSYDRPAESVVGGVVIVGEGVDKAAATAKRKAARVAQKKRDQARPGDKASGLDAGLAALMGGEADSTKGAYVPPSDDEEDEEEEVEAGPTVEPAVWEVERAARRGLADEDQRWLTARGYSAAAAAAALKNVAGGSALGAAAAAGAAGAAGGVPRRVAALAELYRWTEGTAGEEETASADAGKYEVECAGGAYEGGGGGDEDAHAEAAEERGYEREALAAIFPPEEITFPGAPWVEGEEGITALDCVVTVPRFEPPSLLTESAEPPVLTMEVFVDGGVAPSYPVARAPVIAVRGGGLPEKALRRVTRAAIRSMREMLGAPVIYEATQVVGDEATVIGENMVAKRAKREAAAEAEAAKKAKANEVSPEVAAKRAEKSALLRAQRQADAMSRLGQVAPNVRLPGGGSAGGGGGGKPAATASACAVAVNDDGGNWFDDDDSDEGKGIDDGDYDDLF